jgi:ABC-type lipoprotein release transport system permease subunit
MGTYNTETYDYNPYDQKYEENGFSVDDQEGGIKKAAKTNISKRVNPTFIESPSRYFNYIKDIGTLPAGSNLKEQLKKVDEPNLELTDTAAQAAMRYQQAFTIQLSITIAGNLGVNVGDMVYIEIPEVSAGNTPKAEKTNSGLYMISELCHKLTPSRTVSKLILVRDSYDK